MNNPEIRGSRAILKTFDILEIMTQHPSGIMLSEISKQLGLPKSTTHRILQALVERNMVRTAKANGAYRLGYGVLSLSRAFMDGFDIVNESRPILEKINKAVGETVHLAALDGTRKWVVYLDKVDALHPQRVFSRIGKLAPIHCTALGKALVSNLPSQEITTLLEGYAFTKVTSFTVDNEAAFFDEIEETRKRGYAVDHKEYELDVHCIATSLTNQSNYPLAAIGISWPNSRFNEHKMRRALEIITAEAKNISTLFENVNIYE